MVHSSFVVGLTGPSNSGKTTLVNLVGKELRKSGYTVHTIEESVKKIFNEKWSSKYKSLYEIIEGNEYLKFQFDILNTLRDNIFEAIDSKYEIIITDRTFFDILFYTLAFTQMNTASYNLCSICLEYMRMYDLVINVKRLDTIDNTGIRKSFIDLGYNYLRFEDGFFEHLVPSSCNKYIKIKNKDLEERVFTTIKIITQEFQNDKNRRQSRDSKR